MLPASQSSRTSVTPASLPPECSLEHAPLLDGGEARYAVAIWPQAGEAAVVRLTGAGGDGPVPTPEQLAKRPERNAQAHARRAKGRIRRYIRANRCRFMWTFTERADVRDFDEACEHVDAFLRALRETFGAEPVLARMGGTIPVTADIQDALHPNLVVLGFGLPDDGNHAPNERFSVAHFHGATETLLRVLDELGRTG